MSIFTAVAAHISTNFHIRSTVLSYFALIITVPSVVNNVMVKAINGTAFNISWTPGIGGHTSFEITYNCECPDVPYLNVSSDNTIESTFIKTGLEPGTLCWVFIATRAGKQKGQKSDTAQQYGTYEGGESRCPYINNKRKQTKTNNYKPGNTV